MTALPDGTLIAWLGDDFTGSAATLEVLAFAGLPSVLFLEIPTADQRARFPDARGIGIATTARGYGPDWMDEKLPDRFQFLADTGAPIVHYKVCSTLDSAPHVGSIGKAIDIGSRIVAGDWIPCLVAAPPLRRFQVFGHLFAGAPEGVFRLDRHPVMARHPVTPMTESDVALHLSRQTEKPFGLVSLDDLATAPRAGLTRELDRGATVVSLDTLTMADAARCGDLIWTERDGQILAVGSQGLEYALVAHWREAGLIPEQHRTAGAGSVDRIVAVSGSVSPVTAAQIAWAEDNGFAVIPLDAVGAVTGESGVEERACEQALKAVLAGQDPLVCTARGPDDPAVARTRQSISTTGIAIDEANARIGAALGRILRRLLRETGIRRAVISGGDTSGHASRQLDIFAFTALSPTIPGAALLQAHSEDPTYSGLQLALKGGQMGSADYFGRIKRGGDAEPL